MAVHSTPDGAGISLDGLPKGLVTPDTLEGIPQGEHTLHVQLVGHEPDQAALTVEIIPGGIALADFTLTEIPGSLAVTSTPSGASVLLDGEDTGEVTDTTVVGLSQGEHVVAVQLAGYDVDPPSVTVVIEPDGVAAADFALTPVAVPVTKVVLLEGFSNVCCLGCPDMNAALHELMATPGYGTNQVLLIKYALNFPSPSDPHYLANIEDNEARGWGTNYDMTGYYADAFTALPALFGDGTCFGAGAEVPLDQLELRDLINPLLAQEPGFAIQVASVYAGTEVDVTVTVAADSAVDLTDLTLNAVLVQNPVVHETLPDCAEELEFHWIMRDFAIVTTSVGQIEPGTPVVRTVTLASNIMWPADDLYVIAFVQDDKTRKMLQAGSNITAAAAKTSSYATSTGITPSFPASQGDQP